MLAKCSCQFCNEHIEFDSQYAGTTVKCPHCFTQTKLYVTDAPTHSPEASRSPDWRDEPITEKQKAMLVLHGIEQTDGLGKWEAIKLIDAAVQSGRPTIHGAAKGGEMFGKIRLNEITEEITKAINIIGDDSVTITALKCAKRDVKASVKNLTDIIDRRITTIKENNLNDWIKKNE